GVGLVAAIPAGLAGAAAISATLAAFGPGGMVGGMVTLAALTGTGTAFLGGGVVAQPSTSSSRFDRAALIHTAADGIAKQPGDPAVGTARLSFSSCARRLSSFTETRTRDVHATLFRPDSRRRRGSARRSPVSGPM